MTIKEYWKLHNHCIKYPKDLDAKRKFRKAQKALSKRDRWFI